MLSILMPVYNERERVERAIAEVLATELPDEFELIVVDDGSTDGTREILRGGDWDERVRLFEHEHNQGKGAAIQTALAQARGDFAAIFDADLEYDPADLGLLMPPLLDGRSNACFGVRAFDGYTSHSFLFVLGNKGVTLACNMLYNVYLHDIMTCHKMIRTDLFRSLSLRSPGFAIEPEITARLVQRGERIFEVPGPLPGALHRRGQEADRARRLPRDRHAVALPVRRRPQRARSSADAARFDELGPQSGEVLARPRNRGPWPRCARCALRAARAAGVIAGAIWTVDCRSTGSPEQRRRVAVLVDLALSHPRRVAERIAAGPARPGGEGLQREPDRARTDRAWWRTRPGGSRPRRPGTGRCHAPRPARCGCPRTRTR